MNNTIKAIDKSTVNKICSGQVVLTLATAIKELLENSLDAGSTSVQIKLKEYGSECIEVVDNGHGVEESNFKGLTLKHHTSKISEFEDLESVATFGFRGEALSSLCSLGKMTIITRHKNALMGTRMRFDHNGTIIESTNLARQVGTTVIVENLFVTLPVRHKEFLRNLKKDFSKLCQVLQAYALLNKHCSMHCTNRVGVNNRTFLEKQTGSLRDSISSIFGPKQLSKLLEIKTEMPDEETLLEFRCGSVSSAKVTLTGFISSCEHGVGRSSQDRQFFYINSRPVDNSKISKVVNEIYHQFNRHQYPFVVMDITLAAESVDVNVVPDKRKIMLENEGLVLATIKTSIEQLLKPIPTHMDINMGKPIINCTPIDTFSSNKIISQAWVTNTKPTGLKQIQSLEKYVSRKAVLNVCSEPLPKRAKVEPNLEIKQAGCIMEILIPKPKKEINNQTQKLPETMQLNEDNLKEVPKNHELHEGVFEKERNGLLKIEHNDANINMDHHEIDDGITEEEKESRRKIIYPLSLEEIVSKRRKRTPKTPRNTDVKFFAKIDPSANERAEDELQKQLSQTAFLNMKILGQFNKGFIITRLDSDLFIIDQHATDEKANFEAISAKKLETQRLTMPQLLHLDAGKEELIQHRIDVFRYNGFDIRVDGNAPTTRRIHLTAVPSIQGVTFNHRDVDELLFLLMDAPDGQMFRPSRVRDVIASKACRMSVMVGTALNHAQMKRLVHRMSELKQPWNCPHGRPTIRHLLSMGLLNKDDD